MFVRQACLPRGVILFVDDSGGILGPRLIEGCLLALDFVVLPKCLDVLEA